MKIIKRWLQIVTGLHRIHHDRYGYGWRPPFVGVAFFPKRPARGDAPERPSAWHRVERSQYHDCTATGRY